MEPIWQQTQPLAPPEVYLQPWPLPQRAGPSSQPMLTWLIWESSLVQAVSCAGPSPSIQARSSPCSRLSSVTAFSSSLGHAGLWPVPLSAVTCSTGSPYQGFLPIQHKCPFLLHFPGVGRLTSCEDEDSSHMAGEGLWQALVAGALAHLHGGLPVASSVS